MTKKVFGYLRVSGKGQLDGDGFDRQRDTIKRFCDVQGWTVIRWFMDGAISGEVETEDREGFADMIGFCGDATTMTIVVEDAMRLARSLIVSELACEEARKRNIEIVVATTGQVLTDDSTPDRVMVRQIFGVLAQWNKNVTISRLSAARRRKRMEGNRCEGRKPLDDPATIEKIMWLHEAGWSYRQIAKELRRLKYAPPQGEAGKYWSTGTIHGVVAREDEKALALAQPRKPGSRSNKPIIEFLVTPS